jgi:hypothetical protein
MLAGCAREPELASQWSFLDTYCTDCHNSAEFAGDLSFEARSPDDIHAEPEIWEQVSVRLRGSLMPPPGNPRPGAAETDQFIAALEARLDRNPNLPRAGHVPLQRLNRTEYAAAVEDLLHVRIDPAEHLPTEMEVDGFTNIAAALSVSPAFLEQYVSVARTVAKLALGSTQPKLSSVYFPPPEGDQDGYVDGMPLGTRGGVAFEYNFPADGEYRFNITDLDVGLYPRSLETEHTVVMLVDRNEVFRAQLGGPDDLVLVDRGGAPARAQIMERFSGIPVQVTAGPHEIAVTFIERARAATDGTTFGFVPYGGFSFTGAMRVPRVIGGIEVVGPFQPTGISQTASRAGILICQPEIAPRERECAERIAENLARRAFRRPVTSQDLDALMPFFEAGRSDSGHFEGGIERLVTAILASPDFLYRTIRPADHADAEFALNSFELASRLAFFIWSRGPDDELLALAESGQLHEPSMLVAQVERMLADPRAESLIENFAMRWLNVDDLHAVDPDDRLFPEFDELLRQAFRTEIRLFLSSVLLENASVRELLTADYTFLNEQLARHYGIEEVHGPQFRRVELQDEARFGLLGKAAVLLRTSYGDRTSPVLRGAWVLEKLMGTPPTPPPPNVETDLSTPEGELPKTVRVRLERHRESQVCNSCHGVIDPFGLALENFTAIGQWRDNDVLANAPIDASTMLPNGKAIVGPIQLREALLARSDQFALALTEKLMMYALGRELEYHDLPQVRAVVRDAADDDYRFAALVAGIVSSDAFRMQQQE